MPERRQEIMQAFHALAEDWPRRLQLHLQDGHSPDVGQNLGAGDYPVVDRRDHDGEAVRAYQQRPRIS